jgi:ADP-heptose:LPS heptosyltransferase
LRDAEPRLLFVPVSGAFGMGEFARSSAIARAVQQRWPAARIHFVLSRQAPYAAGAPFPVTLVPSSATFHSGVVIDLIRSWRPHVVVFDNAGRTAQLRAAQRSGARVVYISARARQRRKAFRFRWMRLIDEHWIAYPEFIAGSLTLTERLKRRLLGRPTVRYLDVIFSRGPPKDGERAASRKRGDFVLVVPGGGTGHPGAEDATAQFLEAARMLAAGGTAVRYVGPAAAAEPTGALELTGAASPLFQPLGALPQAELAELMRHARLIVVNGGSTLLQAIACGAACVAVPIAGDQRERIRRCVSAGVAVQAALDAPEIAARAQALLRDEPSRAALALRAQGLALADGVEVALNVLGRYIESE